MTQKFRCDCPITSALDILGDKWMLVIIKQMLIEGMKTFKEFTESDEAIATNILSSKLKCLEQYGLIKRINHPTNKKTKLYHLTENGLSLTPIIVELALWSDQNLRDFNPIMRQSDELESMKSNKEEFIEKLKENYREKLATA
ncbi:MAG: helix-turn-helix transcriptional regulator [Phaeodactylibacter sp.]|nr:helix-turn-helix transcriptional regulator [Phaeodactylibacter sp.]